MIYTFYSFKGGVGRSMGMAAVGYVLAKRGLRVLVIDFDLEAPGLERYFFEPERAQEMRGQLGLVDLLQTYKLALTSENGFREARFRKWWSYVQEAIPSVAGPGSVDLMTAGQREPEAKLREYAAAVRSFDWLDFYHNWKGDQFFEWLRKQLLSGAEGAVEPYDVVLVDSRTGVTEMGGVCAYQLADCAVMLCAPNYQNIDGTLAVARDFQSEAVRALRRGRPLDLLILPARLEENNDLREQFLAKFESTFERSLYLPRALYEVGLDYRALAQPYDPQIAVIERLVGDADSPSALSSSSKAIESVGRLADALTLLAASPGKLYEQQAAVLARLRGVDPQAQAVEQIADPTHRTSGFDVFIDCSRKDEPTAAALAARLQNAGLNVWRDVENLRAGASWSEQLQQILATSDALLVIIGTGAPSSHLGRSVAMAQQRGRPRIVPVVVQDGDTQNPLTPEILAGLGLLEVPLFTIDAQVEDESRSELLLQALRKRRADAPAPAKVQAVERDPYPGERPLSEDDASFFFGREKELDSLLSLASASRVSVLTGPAGVGKTSLLCAGVMARLRRGAPSVELELINCAELQGEEQLRERLESRRQWPAWLILDSVDTFHANGQPAAVRERIDLVSHVLDEAPHDTRIILAQRDALDDDMRAHAIERWRLTDDRARVHMSLAAMSSQAMQAAIERPAAQLGHVIEPGLTKLLIDNAGSAYSGIAQIARVLPLLWAERRRGWITTRTYEAIGGVQRTFENAVVAASGLLSEQDGAAFHCLVAALTQFDAAMQLTAEPAHWPALATIPDIAAADAIVVRDRLASRHLIDLWRTQTNIGMSRPDSGAAAAGPMAVALLYGTPRHYGRSFTDQLDLGFLLWRRKFGAYVRVWDQSNRSNLALVQGTALQEAEGAAAGHENMLSEPERKLLDASKEWQVKVREQERERERKRQVRRLRVVLGVVLFLLFGVVLVAIEAIDSRTEATLRAAQATRRVAQAEQSLAEITKTLAQLRNSATTLPDSPLKSSIYEAESSITQQVSELTSAVVTLPPRVYVQIADDSQRKIARVLEQRIEAQRIDDAAIAVPGIELVQVAPSNSSLRCFKPEECSQVGARLQAIINAELVQPQIQLQDLSRLAQRQSKETARPMHFELWFAKGPIILKQEAYAAKEPK